MRQQFKRLTWAFILSFAFAAHSYAETRDVVEADSDEAVHRLELAGNADFLPLANHFERQQNDYFCGVASSVIALNALAEKNGTATQENFFDRQGEGVKAKGQVMGDPAPNGKVDPGFQLAQLQRALEAHGLKVQRRVAAEDFPDDIIRSEITANLKRKGDFVLVNYYRPKLGQEGGGHISPLGAYDAESDSVLILDVNPTVAEWVWVKLPVLISAMRTLDTDQNRGYLLVSR